MGKRDIVLHPEGKVKTALFIKNKMTHWNYLFSICLFLFLNSCENPMKSSEDWENEGCNLIHEKKFELAINCFDKTIEKSSLSKLARLYAIRAYCNFEIGRYENVVEDCDSTTKYSAFIILPNDPIGLKLKPEFPDYFLKAKAEFNLKRYYKCLEDCDKSLAYKPGNGNVYLLKFKVDSVLGLKMERINDSLLADEYCAGCPLE